jgi:branched-subunit amino acid ABC-type transport system permease component
MSELLGYALPGIPYGCTFALVAIGLVLTYRSTGVFNFAFGAQAYVAALVYTVLTEHGVARGTAGVLVILVLSPVLGVIFDRLVFSRIASANVAAKTVAALGLMVGLPALASVIFGPATRNAPPSLLFNVNNVVLHVDGTPINGEQLSTVLVTLAVLAVLSTVLRKTVLGLSMRAAVESPRMLRLQGVASGRVTASAWAVSSAMAGLAGILLAPRYGQVSVDNYTFLLVGAIAAAAVAGLSSMELAAGVSILMGVAIGVSTGYAPSGSVWSTGLLAAIPFFLLLIVLAFDPRLRHLEVSDDPLAAVDPPPTPMLPPDRSVLLDRSLKGIGIAILVAAVASMLTWVPAVWVFSLTGGLALALVFFSITLITGAAGQISLCQATFAGVGAFTAGQLATNRGVPIVTGALIGALVAAAAGVLAVLPALRLRGLALSLSTLTIALLADALVFPTSYVGGPPSGLTVPRPTLGSISFATESTRSLFLLVLVFVIVVGFFVRRILLGASGRSLEATKQSPLATAGLGYSLAKGKLAVFALAAALAGIGGGLYGSLLQVVSPADFTYQSSLLFVVIVVTVGARSVAGAIEAGIAYAALTQLLSYLPNRAAPSSIVALAFAVGAFRYATHPEGVVEDARRRSSAWIDRQLDRVRSPRLAIAQEVAT